MDEFTKPAGKKLVETVSADIYIEAKKWLSQIDPQDVKLSKYRESIFKKLGTIQVMGMPNPRKLDQVYIGLRVVKNFKKFSRDPKKLLNDTQENLAHNVSSVLKKREDEGIDKIISQLGYSSVLEEIEDSIDNNSSEYQSPTEEFEDYEQSMHGMDAVNITKKHQRISIIGNPGSGKTTFLKYLSLAYTGQAPTTEEIEPLLPIYVELKELDRVDNPKPSSDWLLNFAIDCASEYVNAKLTRQWLEGILVRGKCIVLLDGIDEVPQQHLDFIIGAINAFATKYEKNRMICTCRSSSYEKNLQNFQVCEIDDFNEEDRISFIKNWFGAGSREELDLNDDLKSSRTARDLCRTPLLLTMICVQYGFRRAIPDSRAELYDSCVDALMYRWDTYRAVDRTSYAPNLTHDRKKLLLTKIAKNTFDRGIKYLKKRTLIKLFKLELDSLGYDKVTAPDLLNDLEKSTGLILEMSPSIYGFSHLTFQEFFTSVAYVDDGKIEKLYQNSMSDKRYREVLLMALERSYSCNDIVLFVISKYINDWNQGYDNEYVKSLIKDISKLHIGLNKKVRLLLNNVIIFPPDKERDEPVWDQILAMKSEPRDDEFLLDEIFEDEEGYDF